MTPNLRNQIISFYEETNIEYRHVVSKKTNSVTGKRKAKIRLKLVFYTKFMMSKKTPPTRLIISVWMTAKVSICDTTQYISCFR